MSFYGPKETWKVVYIPKMATAGIRGVALVEAADNRSAMFTFSQEYAGQYHTIESCTKLFDKS